MEDPENPSPETEERWRNDPDNWIWGIFYYNKEDGRLLPPKRNPIMGFTINFANPNSVLFFVIVVLFFLLITFIIASKN